jgi:hypothetical protein
MNWKEELARFDAQSLRIQPIIMSEQNYQDILEYQGSPRCAICNKFISSLEKHCEEMNDKEHLILLVHGG